MQRLPYKGKIVRRRSLSSFGLVEAAFPAGVGVEKHLHLYPYISFLLRGSYSERGVSQSYNCSVGSVIFHPAGDEHSDQFDRFGGHLLNLQLDSDWLAGLPGFSRKVREATVLSPSCFRLGLELQAGFDSLSPESVDGIAIELICSAASLQQLPVPPKWLKDSLRIIETSVRNGQSPSLRETARRCEVHPVHLSRCYSKFMGMTFSRYVNQQCIKQASRALLETDRAIVEIALDCGFADHAHLCRTFKSAIGLTPTEFRARFART